MASKKKNLNRSTRNTVERPAPLVGAVIRNTVVVFCFRSENFKDASPFFIFHIFVFSRLGKISSFFNI